MKNIYKILQNKRYFITWTICYIFVLWAILYFLFNFSIFNLSQWNRLIHAQLTGFAGFVFGLLILAAGPLYVATSVLIIKKNKPLITIPVPKIPQIIKKPEIKPEPKQDTTPDTTQPAPAPDRDLPLEIKPMFARAKLHPLNITIKKSPETPTPDANTHIDTIPLPNDFDISFDDTDYDTDDDINNEASPVFTTLNFDDDESENELICNINKKLLNHLDDKSVSYTTHDDIVITPDMAIITHDDADFWVTDNDNWFATGKTKTSPIQTVKSIAEQHNVKPVIYLAEQNIMDIDTLIPQWESDGITVITNLTEL